MCNNGDVPYYKSGVKSSEQLKRPPREESVGGKGAHIVRLEGTMKVLAVAPVLSCSRHPCRTFCWPIQRSG